jgi:hypothetical protein
MRRTTMGVDLICVAVHHYSLFLPSALLPGTFSCEFRPGRPTERQDFLSAMTIAAATTHQAAE